MSRFLRKLSEGNSVNLNRHFREVRKHLKHLENNLDFALLGIKPILLQTQASFYSSKDGNQAIQVPVMTK